MNFKQTAWLALLAFPMQSFAQSSTSAVPVSVSDQSISDSRSILSKLKSDSTHTYYGPALTDPGARKRADAGKDIYEPIYIRNQINLGYRIQEKTTLSGVADFDYWLSDVSGNPANKGFHWRDCFVKLKRSDLMNRDIGGHALTLDGDLRYYMPTSKFSRITDSYGSVRVSLNPSLQFNDSRWSITTVNYVRYFLQKHRNIPGNQDAPLSSLLLYTGPQVNYMFSDRASGFLLMEANVMFDTHGIPNTRDDNASLVSLQPGVAVNVSDRVVLTPSLNWFTNQPLETTSFHLTADISLL